MSWNGSDQKTLLRSPKSNSSNSFRCRIVWSIFSAVGLVSLLMLCFYCFSNNKPLQEANNDIPKDPVRSPVIKTPNKIISTRDETVMQTCNVASTNSPIWESAASLPAELFPYTDGRKVLSTKTNDWDQIVDICIMPNGKSRKVIRKATPQTFQYLTDQLIAMVISGDNNIDSTPIPIDDNLEVEFLRSLNTPILINETDSDSVKKSKRDVIEARKIIHEELRKGISFKEILVSHLNMRRDNAEIRAEANSAIREVKRSGDPELLDDYVSRINDLFEGKGIDPISIPMNKNERRALKESQQH